MGRNQRYYDMGVSENGVIGPAHGRSNREDDERF